MFKIALNARINTIEFDSFFAYKMNYCKDINTIEFDIFIAYKVTSLPY